MPGHDVTNITIEDSVVSTSISNTMRVAWPEKTFRSAHVAMRNVDVLHTGYGACVVPFAFFELWADPGGQGSHTDFRFSDIRLEDYYSLMQVRYPDPGVDGVVFSNVSALDGPPMVPSVLAGDVRGVALSGVRVKGRLATRDADVPVKVEEGAAQPTIGRGMTDASFSISGGLIRPGQPVTFGCWRRRRDGVITGSSAMGRAARVRSFAMRFRTPRARCSTGRGDSGCCCTRRGHPMTRCGRRGRWWSRGSRCPALALPMATLPGLAVVQHPDGSTDEDGWVRIPRRRRHYADAADQPAGDGDF